MVRTQRRITSLSKWHHMDWDIESFMVDNPLLAFQSRLFKGPILQEEQTEDGIFLLPPMAPGLGLVVDEVVAEECLVRE